MKKSLTLVTLSLGFILHVSAQKSPNIIFILADDLGWQDVGFMGNEVIETPNLDKLANNGMFFTQGYSTGPMCTPTRASVMTGKYPCDMQMHAVIPSLKPNPGWDYGVPRNDNYDFFETGDREYSNVKSRSYLPLEETTIAEYLKEEGYRTCYIGKWHLGHQPYHPIYQGFDVQIGTSNYGSPPTYFYLYKTMRNNQLRTLEDLNKDGKRSEYLTDRLTDEAIGFINENKKNPFFLSLDFHNPHSPYYAKEELREYYEKSKNLSGIDAIYAAMIHILDENVGKLIKTLKKLGLSKNTLVIFTSDNGGVKNVSYLKPLRGHKGNLYEGGIRVPVIFSFPGKIAPSKNENTMASSVDYLPTILAFAGVSLNDKKVRGKNLSSILLGMENNLNNRLLYWYSPQLEMDMVVRKGDYKLIMNSRNEKKELYNLDEDPGESNDLSNENQKETTELESLLTTFLKTIDNK